MTGAIKVIGGSVAAGAADGGEYVGPAGDAALLLGRVEKGERRVGHADDRGQCGCVGARTITAPASSSCRWRSDAALPVTA